MQAHLHPPQAKENSWSRKINVVRIQNPPRAGLHRPQEPNPRRKLETLTRRAAPKPPGDTASASALQVFDLGVNLLHVRLECLPGWVRGSRETKRRHGQNESASRVIPDSQVSCSFTRPCLQECDSVITSSFALFITQYGPIRR